MERSTEELKKEGEEIAKKLGNGVIYNGPWLDDGSLDDGSEGKLVFHTFTDAAETGTTFVAKTLKQAKQRLMKKRKMYNAP